MTILKLGVHQLPQPEAGLVRALVVLLAQDHAGFRWTFAADGPHDALIADPACDPASLAARGACVALLAADAAGPRKGVEVLKRPLDKGQLAAWLGRAEERLGAQRQTALADAPPTVPAAAYRLRRWPPQSLLRPDPRHLRAAAVLARRPTEARQLAAHCGYPVDACLAFLQALRAHGLLETDPPTPLRARQPGVAAALRDRLPA